MDLVLEKLRRKKFW